MFLDNFISVPSGGNIATQYKNTTQINVTHAEYDFIYYLEIWANAQHDGHPVEHRWRPLFNAAKCG